jgi:hypothetical protein
VSDLSRRSQALFQGARDDFEPTPVDRARVERAIALRLGIAAGTAAATASAASASIAPAGAAGAGVGALASAGASSTLVVAAKWVGAIALAGGLATGGIVYRADHVRPVSAPRAALAKSEAPDANPASVLPRQRMKTDTVPPPPVDVPLAEVAVAAPPQTLPPGPAVVAETAPPGTGKALHPSVPRVTFPEARGTVADETRLLRDADGALRGGDPARALTLLDEHARTYPRGVLKEERAAERVFALCKLGRVAEARAEALPFLRANGESPLAEGVRTACASDLAPSNRAP